MSDQATILLVDDNADNRRLLARVIQQLGHATIEAADGPEGLELAPKADLILLDVMMPGMDGFEVCTRLRQDPRTRFTPIVLVTALTERDQRVKGLDAGADDFLTKPVDRAEVTARITSLLRLQHQRAELERLKNEWTAMLVHDLRNPLQVIQGFAQLLQTPARTPEEAAIVERILDNAGRMRTLVDAVLDVSRLEAGKVDLALGVVHPTDLLQEAVAHVQPLADGRRLLIRSEWPERLPALLADGRKLQQVLANLLDNAIKFAATTVTVGGTADGHWLTVSVANDGAIIPPEQVPGLFERWQQSETGRNLGVGSGLGLAIVQRLVEAHGGRIAAEAHPQGGLTVRISLPLPPAA